MPLVLPHNSLVACVQVRLFQISLIVFALTPYFAETLTLFPFTLIRESCMHDSKVVGATRASFSAYTSAASLPFRITLGLDDGIWTDDMAELV
jgi:hypothetical protein